MGLEPIIFTAHTCRTYPGPRRLQHLAASIGADEANSGPSRFEYQGSGYRSLNRRRRLLLTKQRAPITAH